MNKTILKSLVGLGVACLVVIPNRSLSAAGLRGEAVTYREEGHKKQQEGDLSGALTAYQKALALDPSDAVLQNYFGMLYERGGQLEAAKQAYLKAIALDANYVEPLTNLAVLHARQGEKGQALIYWRRAAQLSQPDDPWLSDAETQLKAHGIPLVGRASRRSVAQQELNDYQRSMDEFRAVTEQWYRK